MLANRNLRETSSLTCNNNFKELNLLKTYFFLYLKTKQILRSFYKIISLKNIMGSI